MRFSMQGSHNKRNLQLLCVASDLTQQFVLYAGLPQRQVLSTVLLLWSLVSKSNLVIRFSADSKSVYF